MSVSACLCSHKISNFLRDQYICLILIVWEHYGKNKGGSSERRTSLGLSNELARKVLLRTTSFVNVKKLLEFEETLHNV